MKRNKYFIIAFLALSISALNGCSSKEKVITPNNEVNAPIATETSDTDTIHSTPETIQSTILQGSNPPSTKSRSKTPDNKVKRQSEKNDTTTTDLSNQEKKDTVSSNKSSKTGKNSKSTHKKTPSAPSPTPKAKSEKAKEESFYGILMDYDCSDMANPEEHELACMFMEECRASGYGLDILQADGSYKFIPFDEKGQSLTWDYINHTSRPDHLYVTVVGTYKNGTIYVTSITES